MCFAVCTPLRKISYKQVILKWIYTLTLCLFLVSSFEVYSGTMWIRFVFSLLVVSYFDNYIRLQRYQYFTLAFHWTSIMTTDSKYSSHHHSWHGGRALARGESTRIVNNGHSLPVAHKQMEALASTQACLCRTPVDQVWCAVTTSQSRFLNSWQTVRHSVRKARGRTWKIKQQLISVHIKSIGWDWPFSRQCGRVLRSRPITSPVVSDTLSLYHRLYR